MECAEAQHAWGRITCMGVHQRTWRLGLLAIPTSQACKPGELPGVRSTLFQHHNWRPQSLWVLIWCAQEVCSEDARPDQCLESVKFRAQSSAWLRHVLFGILSIHDADSHKELPLRKRSITEGQTHSVKVTPPGLVMDDSGRRTMVVGRRRRRTSTDGG